MNWIQKLVSTPIPPKLAQRPKDERGFVIPYFAARDAGGKADFRVVDQAKWLKAIARQLCGLCGQRINYYKGFYFVGGPMSIKSGVYGDLAMHEECVRFALSICPFLAMPRFSYADPDTIAKEMGPIRVDALSSTERPDRFGLIKTKGYKLVKFRDGSYAIQADVPSAPVEWFEVPMTSGVNVDSAPTT